MAGPLLIAGITAGSQIAGVGINAASQGNQNRKNRRFTRQMYARQREDALLDWHMQNQYNSPAEQMRRLKAAGLNPNLVYGDGPVANNTQAPRSADAPTINHPAPQFDLGSAAQAGLSAYYDMQMKEAQINNLETQNTVLTQDAIYKAAQTEATLAGTATSKFDLALKTDLRQTSIDAMKAALQKTLTDTQFTLDQNERAAIANTQSIQESVTRIAQMRSQIATDGVTRGKIQKEIQNIGMDMELKQLDIDLKKLGLQPTDPAWQRVVARAVNKLGLPSVDKIDLKPKFHKPQFKRDLNYLIPSGRKGGNR